MIPNELGNYILQDEIGKGPSATIVKAINRISTDEAALKVFNDDLQNKGQLLKELQRAAVIASSLDHLNIAKVYGLESDRTSGCQFISMEYLDSINLRDLIGADEKIK